MGWRSVFGARLRAECSSACEAGSVEIRSLLRMTKLYKILRPRKRYHVADEKLIFQARTREAPGHTGAEQDHHKTEVGKSRRVVGPATRLVNLAASGAYGSRATDRQNGAGQNGRGSDKKRKTPKTRKSGKKRKKNSPALGGFGLANFERPLAPRSRLA